MTIINWYSKCLCQVLSDRTEWSGMHPCTVSVYRTAYYSNTFSLDDVSETKTQNCLFLCCFEILMLFLKCFLAELLLLHYWPGFRRILAERFVISRKSAANVDLGKNLANPDISRKIMSASRNLKKKIRLVGLPTTIQRKQNTLILVISCSRLCERWVITRLAHPICGLGKLIGRDHFHTFIPISLRTTI